MKGSIREKRPGVWEITVELPRDPATGKRRRTWATVEGQKRKAQNKLHKLLVEAQDTKKRASAISFEKLARAWLTAATARLRPKTMQSYIWRVEHHILPVIGDIAVDELTAAHLDTLYGDLASKGCKSANIRKTHAVISSALNQAVKWGWVERNVAVQASPPKLDQASVSSPSVEQLATIINDAELMHPHWAGIITLAAVTGMRRGEILALRWSDIVDGRIYVKRSLVYTSTTGTVEGPTKTRQSRKISLDQIGMAIIEKQVAALEEATKVLGISSVSDPFLFFAEPDGGTPVHPDSISKIFRKLADAHGWRDLHFHSLRHFTATQLIAAGIDIRTVSGRLGHSDPSVTLRVYSHALEANDREAAAIMGRLIRPQK